VGALRLDRSRVVVVPGATYPALLAREYEQTLREIGVTVWRVIDRDLKPAYESRTDADRVDEDKTGGVLIDLDALLELKHGDGWAERVAGRVAGKVDAHNKLGTYSPIKKLGIDVVRSQGFAGPVLAKWTADNSTLIKSIRSSAIPGLRKDIEEAFAKGLRWEELRDKWVEKGLPLEFGTLEGRARVIARTEMSKLNAELTEARHRDLGVTEYVWRTVGDLRVRDDHRARNGKRYSYDAPDGPRPGRTPNCRCSAEAVMDLDAIEPPQVNTSTAFATKAKPVAAVQAQVAAKKAAAANMKLAAAQAKAAAKAEAKAKAEAAKAVKAAALAHAKALAKAKKMAEQATKKALAAQAAARKSAERAATSVRQAAPVLPQPRSADPLERDVRVPTSDVDAVRIANERVRETAVWENSPNPKLKRIAAAAKFERDLLEEVVREGEIHGKDAYDREQMKDRAEFFAEYMEARRVEAKLPTGTVLPRGQAHAGKGLTSVVKSWVDSQSEDTLKSFRDWTGDHYHAMRGIDSQWVGPAVEKSKHEFAAYRLRIAKIRQAMQEAPAHSGRIIRGMEFSRNPDDPMVAILRTPGGLYDQPSIASWSHDELAARGFSKEGDLSFLVEHVTRRGVSIDNDHTSELGDSEGEVLLDRGTFRVLSSIWDPSVRAWRVQVEDLSSR
jgi:SPP1 gp7 family putative phage head morphogenesis protein